MRSGTTIVTIPGVWYVTTRLTGPAERGSQPAGAWTGLAGAEFGIRPGDRVDAATLEHLVSRFGAFDVVIAGDRGQSARHARALESAREARESGDAATALVYEREASAMSAAFDRGTRAALAAMQHTGEPLTDDRVAPWNRPDPVSLGQEWIIASFRHDTDDETDDPLLRTHNIVPAITDSQWAALRGADASPGDLP